MVLWTPLALSGAPWTSLENFDVKSIPDDADTGYIPKVDLEYPAAIHDIHSDLPVAPDSQAVQIDDLSPYSQHLHELYTSNLLHI